MNLNTGLITTASLALAIFCMQATAGGDAAAGKQKSAPCAVCHGADGNSQSAQFPRLAGQHADYLVKALEDYQSGARKGAIMGPLVAALSAQDRADLASYFARQKNGLRALSFSD